MSISLEVVMTFLENYILYIKIFVGIEGSSILISISMLDPNNISDLRSEIYI